MEEYVRFIQRKPTRIENLDYSRMNYYFVTICTYEKKCIFGTTKQLSKMGEIAKADFDLINTSYNGVYLDQFIVMPNHVHAIIIIDKTEGITGKTTLSSIVGSYKSGVSRKIRAQYPNTIVWQRSFHDHIIRNQMEYEKIWNYVVHNSQKWEDDCFYSSNTTA